MHEIEPHYGWEKYYVASNDPRSPFHDEVYDLSRCTHAIYDHYIHPLWDYLGSDTLYCKVLYADYEQSFAIIEFLGEWNDTLYNDVMYLKRNIIDHMLKQGINQFILIGENVLNFHGSDDSYYEEWFEDVEEGWIVAIGLRDHVKEEMQKYNVDWYVSWGGQLEIHQWRTFKPQVLFELVKQKITLRLN